MSDTERLESLSEIERLLREIKSARSDLRRHRREFKRSQDEHSRELAKSEILRDLFRIETFAECLFQEARRLAHKGGFR